MSRVRIAVERAWRREGLAGRALRLLLIPASLLFSAAVRLRALVYRLRLRRNRVLPAPVISVGNLSVGGTGKTPTALWLAEALRRHGYAVAILSRGYGGSANEATLVGEAPEAKKKCRASNDVTVVGDETLLLARRFGGPVVVAPRRIEAGALACAHLGAQVLVLDDGFQHLALRRDFDLVCLRAGTFGDDRVLPAGRLREPPSALQRADAVIVDAGEPPQSLPARMQRQLAKRPHFRARLRAVALMTPSGGSWRELPMGTLAGRRSIGVAGLADPHSFYRTLHEWDVQLEDFLEFPDHHVYTHEDWKRIAYRSREVDLVVTTEKDLVKLERFPFAKEKLVAVRVSMEVEDGERLVDSVVAAIEKRRQDVRAAAGATAS